MVGRQGRLDPLTMLSHSASSEGRQLLQEGENWGRAHGAQFASLEFHVSNTLAGRFYQHRMGYSVASMTAIKRL